jgi:transcriptional regulator with XRE-family HTH domain
MNDTSPEASIQRFAADLKRIREARDVSLADIREATRVSKDVLDDFESGALFNRDSFNPVYLRSLAKSYARHVGISPTQRVLEYMELAEANRYANELAVEELDEEPRSIDWADADDKRESKDEGSAPGPSARDTGPPAPASRNASSSTDEAAESPQSRADPDGRRWSSSGASVSSGGGASSGATMRLLVLGAVLLLVVGGVVWGLVQWSGSDGASPEDPVPEESAPAPPDTVQSSAPAGPPPPVLDDTIYATIYATRGSVDGVRVQRDNDLRRPYWIEEGTAVVLPFTERITIEGQLDQFQLFVNEYPMPLEPLDSQGRRVLTRNDLNTWADTTQAAPADTLPLPADTLRIP